MPRTRSSPETQPSINEDRVMQFGVVVGYDGNSYDPATTYFEYVVNNYDENDVVVESHTRRLFWADIPSPVKTELKAIYDRVLTDAENQGFIGAGTDSGDPE